MKWLEVQIKTTAENEEIVSEILYKYGATGLAIEDPNDIVEFSKNVKDWDFIDSSLTDNPSEGILIKAYYSLENGIMDQVELIREEIEIFPINKSEKPYGQISTFEVDDSDWSDNWKKYFSTLTIGDHIIIKPSWEPYEEKDGDIVIVLDPGMAFGTGTHETTKMCAEALNKYEKPDSIVFDIGCGSGILSIVAAKLGAKKVTAIDLDEMCIKVSLENVENNNVKDTVDVKLGNLLDVIEGKADIIVANIVAEVIVEITGYLKKYLEPNGLFISSGIIVEKISLVKDALITNGFNIIEVNENNGWASIVATI